MKTAHKLILKSYLGPMFLSFFLVMFVLMMNFIWRYIDELVGKGLSMGVIGELMIYASANLVTMALPLATLFAAIMTLGNLGENYELLALKSAGISLPKILQPLMIVVGVVAIGSFFIANNVVPSANKKMSALLFDIRQQKQTIELQDGIFFNGIDNMSIRVERQDPRTKLLEGVMIYDTRNTAGNMTTRMADSGYMSISDDRKYLLITLYDGNTYEETRGSQWFDKSEMQHQVYDVQNGIMDLEGFSLERSDNTMFSGSQTKNMIELKKEIDSLSYVQSLNDINSYRPLLQDYVFKYDKKLVPDSTMVADTVAEQHKAPFSLYDSLTKITIDQKKALFASALRDANNSRGFYSYDESASKDRVAELYKAEVEGHRKVALPFSIIIFFLIGAPLGAIIRKGGLGTPVVISVAFFVIYYIISISGEKMAKEGSLDAFTGMWISALILFPIAIYLTYKATNDSTLLDAEWYRGRWQKARVFLKRLFT